MHFCVTIIVCMIIGYAFGCISPSYIIGRLNNIDIREHGSGNAGTTNTMRVLGKQAGIMVYLGDCIKCVLAIIVAMWIFKGSDENVTLVKLVAGFGAVLGHNYPCWLHFKGGKGIAVTSAVILAVCLPSGWMCPAAALLAFALIVKVTRYVSLGSLMVVVIFLAYVAISFNGDDNYFSMCLFAFLFALSAFYSHRANIVRLINGTENKIGEKRADTQEKMAYTPDNTQNNDEGNFAYNGQDYNNAYINDYDNDMYNYSEEYNYNNHYDTNYNNNYNGDYNNNFYNTPYGTQDYEPGYNDSNGYNDVQNYEQAYNNSNSYNDVHNYNTDYNESNYDKAQDYEPGYNDSNSYNDAHNYEPDYNEHYDKYTDNTYNNYQTNYENTADVDKKEEVKEDLVNEEFDNVEKIKIDETGTEVLCGDNNKTEIIKEEAEIIDVEADEIVEIKEDEK